MKKFVFIIAIGMVAGLVVAQDKVMVQKQQSDVSIKGGADFYSAYVWRGQVISDQMVAQPSVTAAYGPFSLNVWGSLDAGNDDQDNTQVNYTAAYTLPFATNMVKVDAGLICYTYPGTGNGTKPTEELFVKSTFNQIILTPVASVYYDADKANGWYGNLAISQPVEISDALTAKIGGSVGYGTRNYNRCYFGANEATSAVNDYNVYVSTEYALTEKASIGALLQYTLLDGSVGQSAEHDHMVWGGINLSYKFL